MHIDDLRNISSKRSKETEEEIRQYLFGNKVKEEQIIPSVEDYSAEDNSAE